MHERQPLIDRYLAIWNEPDTDRRRALIAATWADDASYIDPLMEGRGHAGIDAMIAAAQQQFPDHRFEQIGALDTHHEHLRFSWVLTSASGAPVVAGTDFGTVGVDGRLRGIVGFLDQLPTTVSAQ